MTKRDVRSNIKLSASALEDLAANLDGQALAAAIKLINAQVRAYGEGIPTSHDLTRIAGVPPRYKAEVRTQLSRMFDTSRDTWAFPEIDDAFKIARYKSRVRARARRGECTPKNAEEAAHEEPSQVRAHAPETPQAVQRDLLSAAAKAPADHDVSSARTPAPGTSSGSQPSTPVSDTPPAPANVTEAPKPTSGPPVQYSMFAGKGAGDDDPTQPAEERARATQNAPQHTQAPAAEGSRKAPPQAPSGASSGHHTGSGAASLVKIAYDRGVALLMDAGQPSDKARRCLAMLLKDYDTAYVIKAIDVIEQRGGRVVEPFSYMRRILQNYPRIQDEQGAAAAARAPQQNGSRTPARESRRPERPRPIATPETMGLSSSLTRRIQEAAQPDDGYILVKGDPDKDAASSTSDKR